MLPKFSYNLRHLIVVLGVGMLFMPKINLVSIAGESAGIRIDDVLLLGIFFLLTIGMIYSPKSKMNSIESVAFILFGFMLVSNFANILLFQRSTLLYSLRYYEYFVFFYIGQYYYDTHYSVIKLLFMLLLFNAILMLLQQFSLIGGFSSAGYIQYVDSRPIGNSGGPWEIGSIINILLAILLFENSELRPLSLIFISVLSFFLVVMTGARMPVLAHTFIISYFFYVHSSNKAVFLRNIIFVLGVLIFAIFLIPNPLAERSQYIFSTENIEYFKNQYALATVPVGSFNGFTDQYIAVENTDASWLMRIGHWIIAIKTWTDSYFALLLGVGPGNWGIALDGGWLRVLTEMGLFGYSIFIVFLSKISKITSGMFVVVVALSINMLFIDIHIAYKAMSLFLFLSGYFYKKSRSNLRKVDSL